MAGKHLRCKSSSNLPDEGVNLGCMWGVLHFFDLHQRLHFRKMLSEKRSGGDGRRIGGIKIPRMKTNIPAAGKEHDHMDAEAKIPVEDKINPTNKTSGKAWLRALIAQEVSKEEGQKRKINPFASRLLRTISMHHLECNDYVRSDDMTTDCDIRGDSLHSHDSDSSANSKHLPLLSKSPDEANYVKRCEVCGSMSGTMNFVEHSQFNELGHQLVEKQALLREKLSDAKKALLEQQNTDNKELRRDVALHQSKDFLDALELFNANRELFLKFVQDPNALANYFHGLQDSRAGVVLAKSGSFPGAGLSGKNGGLSKLKHKRKESESFTKQEGKSQAGNPPSVPNTIDSAKDDWSQFVVSTTDREVDHAIPMIYGAGCSSEFSPSSTHMLKNQRDNGTAVYRFKDIKQRIKDVIKESRKKRDRISMDGVLHKIPFGCKASEDLKGEKPSPWEGSVTDRYDRDSPRSSYGSDGAVSANKNAVGHIRRSRSLTESIDRYSSLLESNVRREPKRQISERLKLAREDGGVLVTSSPKTFRRIFSLPEFESYFSGKDDQSEVSRDALYSRSPSKDLVQDNEAIDISGSDEQKSVDILDASLEHGKENNVSSTTDGAPGQRVLNNGCVGIETYDESDDLTTEKIKSVPLQEQEIAPSMEDNDKPAKPSPISVLDSYLHEDHISPAMFSILQGSELKPRRIHFEELDPYATSQNQSGVDDSHVVETVSADFDEAQISSKHPNFDALHVQVDSKHESEFNYVRDILKKYWFSGDELFGAWYSPDQPLSPSVFEEAEYSPRELETSSGESDINLVHELLFDLTNEVLLEIYGNSYGRCPWLSCVGSHVRPVPVGYHVLEEAWASISWHLNSQPQLNPTLEYIVDRDFRKNDGWMNLQYDVECVGLELESLILDGLLDEAILQFLDSPSH